MAIFKCDKCGATKEGRCKPKKCDKCGEMACMIKQDEGAPAKKATGCGCGCKSKN